jgi:ribosomal-protein-alanine N-acetyltransferase
MDPVVELRPMASTDLPAVMQLLADTPQAPVWREADYRSFFRAQNIHPEEPADPLRRRAWVLSAEGAVFGFAAAALLTTGGASECELEFIVVSPGIRNRGYGAGLIDAVLEWAQASGAQTIRLEVRESNTPAIRLYQRHGFRRNGQRRGYYRAPDEDAILMEAHLSAPPPSDAAPSLTPPDGGRSVVAEE